MKLPPTRNHRQLAAWINANHLIDERGWQVVARVEPSYTNTDSRVAGTRFRRIGKGRRGLRLEIWQKSLVFIAPDGCVVTPADFNKARPLYSHTSSETYRRHKEARAWVESNLWLAR